ncbi:unnamed protein product [Cochlearia groenlandica]
MGFSYGGAGVVIVGVIVRDLITKVCTFLDPTRLFNYYSSESSKRIAVEKNIPMDDMLPPTKLEEMTRVNTPESCRICQEDFDGGEEVRCMKNCIHVFHKICIDRWIHDDQMTCPLCRTPILPDFYFFRL